MASVLGNEVTYRLETLSALHIQAQQNNPPSSPSEGQAWLIGAAATGDWTGQAVDTIAAYYGGWLYIPPQAGMIGWHETAGEFQGYNGSSWVALV